MLPNILRWLTEGLTPYHASYGVLFFKDFVGNLFSKYTEVLTVSAQKLLGIFFSNRRHLAISITVRFFLSETPFCCGVYGVVSWHSLPAVLQNSTNWLEVYSVPLSDLKILMLKLLWFSTRALNHLKIEKTSFFSLIKYTQHILV